MKKLSLKIAIALAAAGMISSATVNAATLSNNEVGDLALVPYYTANAGFMTGLHIVNTSDRAQMVKIRLRRKADSLDAIDFIVAMSPKDMFVGAVVDTPTGIAFRVNDKTCTAPASKPSTVGGEGLLYPVQADNMTNLNVPGAKEGYIEVIGMGAIGYDAVTGFVSPLENSITHNSNGVPNGFDAAYGSNGGCPLLLKNLEAPTTTSAATGAAVQGVTAFNVTNSRSPSTTVPGTFDDVVTNYDDTGDVLKVSYFIRHASSGLEFGNSAYHIGTFAGEAMMANQQYGLVNSYDTPVAPAGWDSGHEFPNLNGGSSVLGQTVLGIGLFNSLRAPAVLGSTNVINDWSVKFANGVSTDWVVTFPGQYLLKQALVAGNVGTDLPVTAIPNVYDREEGKGTPDGLVVSPTQVNVGTIKLPYEVNVVEWYQNATHGPYSVVPSVLSSVAPFQINDNPYDAAGFEPTKGWAELDYAASPLGAFVYDHSQYVAGSLIPNTNPVQAIPGAAVGTSATADLIPTIGFAAWRRNLNQAGRSYGRIVEHSKLSQ